MRRVRLAAAVALVAAGLGTPARAAARTDFAVTPATPDSPATLTVPVRHGGQVSLPLPPLKKGASLAGLHVSAHFASAAEQRRYGAADTTTAPAAGPIAPGGGTDDEAASYPARPPADPGTTTTIAGGNCDGYAATAATVSPLRVAVDKAGRIFWVDRDVAVDRHGSALIRTLDKHGRVRTLGTVVPPDLYRFDKVNPYWEFSVHVVPDDVGGVYVNSGWYQWDPYYGDEQRSGLIVHLDATGHRTVVAGGGTRIGVDQAGTTAAANRDGRPAVQSWLGTVHALARDAHGLYLSEEPGPGLRNLVRFVNTSTQAVTFYANTAQAVVVQPGFIATIAAQSPANDSISSTVTPDANGDAASYYYFKIQDLAVRDQVLYTWDLTFWGVDSGPAHPAPTDDDKVEALNLGFDGGSRTVNAVTVASGQVGVIAGSGKRDGGYAGDGGPAKLAAFNVYWSSYNGGIAVAKDGTVYVADTRNQRVRAVDPKGFINTVAGNGTPGYDGEGAPATSRVWDPIGISVDPSGAPVFAELENARIRRRAPDGTLHTLVGRGPTPCGDGNLATGRTAYGGAYFGRVSDVATDSHGNTYVADISYNVIRRVTPKGVVDLTIGRPTPCGAGRWGEFDKGACTETGPQDGDGGPLGSVGFGDPRFVTVDAYDNLFVSDSDRVRYVNLSNRTVSVLGHTVGPRTVATLATFPRRLVVVVGDFFEKTTVTGQLGDLVPDAHGDLYVADPAYGLIRRLGPCADDGVLAGTSGAIESEGQGDGGPAKAAGVSPTGGMTYDRDRDVLLYVDHPTNGSARIRAINLSDKSLLVIGRRIAAKAIDSVVGVGKCPHDFRGCSYGNGGTAYTAGVSASGLDFDPVTRRLYLTEESNAVRVVLADGRIAGFAGPVPEAAGPPPTVYFGEKPVPVGGYAGDGGPASRAWLRLGTVATGMHSGLAVTRHGDLLVADAGRVRRISDVDNAALRLDATLQEGVPGAGDAFTRPMLLHDGSSDPDGTYAPQLRYLPSIGWVVAGARGIMRGCTAWLVRDDGRDYDSLWATNATTSNAGGHATSGTSCALGATSPSTFAVASVRRVGSGAGLVQRETGVAPVETDLGLEVATSDDGSAWSLDADPPGAERVGTSGLGEVAAGSGGRGIDLAYATSATAFTVVRRGAAGTYTTVGTVPARVASFGTVRQLADGRTLVAFVESGPPATLGNHRNWVSVATVGGSGPARVVRLAEVREDRYGAIATPPSLDVAADGTYVLGYSDTRRIVVVRGTRSGAWSVAFTAHTRGAAVLPSVVAGRRGDVALAYYYGPRIGQAADTAKSADGWYAAVSLVPGSARGAVALDPFVASAHPVEIGRLCLSACVRHPGAADEQIDSRIRYGQQQQPAVLGPVAAAADRNGVLRIAYVVDGRMSGNSSETSALVTQRLCVRARTSKGGKCESTLGVPVDDHPPSVEPPPLPDPPPVGVVCSPVPPPFWRRTVNPPWHPAPQPVETPPPPRPVPPRAVAVLLPILTVPAPPLPIVQPGAQAEGATLTNPQPVAQQQPGIQAGAATDEERQVEVATEYAMSAHREAAPYGVAVWLLGAFAACAAATMSRRRSATAEVPSRVW